MEIVPTPGRMPSLECTRPGFKAVISERSSGWLIRDSARSPTARRAALVPGVYSALTARQAELAGFEAIYVTGAGVANSLLAAPDLGLTSFKEVLDQVQYIVDAVEVPVIVDADTGFGNAVSAGRVVRLLERAGAAAAQLEDQEFPKRCGHFDGKRVVSTEEMVGKIKAAVDARTSDNFLIVGRTDARAELGLDEAIERAERFVEAGADIIMVEAPLEPGRVRRGRAASPRAVPRQPRGGRQGRRADPVAARGDGVRHRAARQHRAAGRDARGHRHPGPPQASTARRPVPRTVRDLAGAAGAGPPGRAPGPRTTVRGEPDETGGAR